MFVNATTNGGQVPTESLTENKAIGVRIETCEVSAEAQPKESMIFSFME